MKTISITNKNKIFTTKELDITFIEIEKKNLDNSIDFLEIDDSIYQEEKYYKILFYNKPIYAIHYPYRNNFLISYGILKEVNVNNFIKHTCSTNYGSSGAPIVLLETLKVIGIHTGSLNIFNLGVFIKIVISKLFGNQRKYLNIAQRRTNTPKNRRIKSKEFELKGNINQLKTSNHSKNKNNKNNKKYIIDQRCEKDDIYFKKLIDETLKNLNNIINKNQYSPYKDRLNYEIKNNLLYKNKRNSNNINYIDKNKNAFITINQRLENNEDIDSMNDIKNNTLFNFNVNKEMINDYRDKNKIINKNIFKKKEYE